MPLALQAKTKLPSLEVPARALIRSPQHSSPLGKLISIRALNLLPSPWEITSSVGFYRIKQYWTPVPLENVGTPPTLLESWKIIDLFEIKPLDPVMYVEDQKKNKKKKTGLFSISWAWTHRGTHPLYFIKS